MSFALVLETGRRIPAGDVKITDSECLIRRERGYRENSLAGVIELPRSTILSVDEQLPSALLLIGAIFNDGIHLELFWRRNYNGRDERRPDDLHFPAASH